MTTKQPIERINSLADERGDATEVACALDFVSWAIKKGSDEKGELFLTTSQSFGLFVLLDTCSKALKEMA